MFLIRIRAGALLAQSAVIAVAATGAAWGQGTTEGEGCPGCRTGSVEMSIKADACCAEQPVRAVFLQECEVVDPSSIKEPAEQAPASGEAKTEADAEAAPACRVAHEKLIEVRDLLNRMEGVRAADHAKGLLVEIYQGVPAGFDEQIKTLVATLLDVKKPQAPPSRYSGEVMRVFHLDAVKLAAALNDTLEDITVKAAASDRLVITSKKPNKKKDIDEIQRRVALLDLPPSRIDLQVWSVSMSDKDPKAVRAATAKVRDLTEELNREILASAQAGWDYIVGVFRKAYDDDDAPRCPVLNQRLEDYVLYPEMKANTETKSGEAESKQEHRLNYRVENRGVPSFSSMLLALALMDQPDEHIQAMMAAMRGAGAEAPGSCPASDESLSAPEERTRVRPCFFRFEAEVRRALGEYQRDVFRAAIVDFLFWYKWSILYPNDGGLSPFYLQRSADHLDTLLGPIIDALNADIEEYLRSESEARLDRIGEVELSEKRRKRTGLRQSGVVTISTLSGAWSMAEGRSVSYFDVTQPATLAELIAAKDAQFDALSPHISGALGQSLGFLAGLLDRPETVVEVGQGIKMTVVPKVLAMGSAAHLDISVAAGEGDAQPKQVGVEGKQDPLDRVAKHAVATSVRVEPMKLFEISTFANDVTRPIPDKPFPPVVGDAWHAFFGAVPGANRLFVQRKPPATVAHRSVILVHALVVPTAMDMALSLRFSVDWDKEQRPPKGARDYHQEFVRCLASSPARRGKTGCAKYGF